MANTLKSDGSSIVYEGVRNAGGPAFVAKLGVGPVTTDGDNVQSQAQAVAGNFQEVAGQGTGVVNAVNTDLFPSIDVSAFKWVSISIQGTFSLTLSWQGSNDNTNWQTVYLWDSSQSGQSAASSGTGSSGKLYFGPVNFRYFRARATAFTSNTSLAGVMELYTVAPGPLPSTSLSGVNTPNANSNQNGTSDYHLVSAATTNANSIKASGGVVYGYEVGNNGTTDAYVKLFNKNAAPTLGTDTPQRTIYVPKGTRQAFHSTTGINFGAGIALAITGAAADTDNTAVALNQVVVDIDWK